MPNPIISPPAESWKPIVGWEGFYEVSTSGRVKSCARTVPHGRHGFVNRSAHLIAPQSMRQGHARVTLHRDGVRADVYVHRAMLEAFVGPCPVGMEACHNDGNPLNNTLPNLRWDTHTANMADKHKHGTARWLMGSENPAAILTEADVVRIRTLLLRKHPYRSIAKQFHVSLAAISAIASRHNWGWLP